VTDKKDAHWNLLISGRLKVMPVCRTGFANFEDITVTTKARASL
jgi:hypothetical protein